MVVMVMVCKLIDQYHNHSIYRISTKKKEKCESRETQESRSLASAFGSVMLRAKV